MTLRGDLCCWRLNYFPLVVPVARRPDKVQDKETWAHETLRSLARCSCMYNVGGGCTVHFEID